MKRTVLLVLALALSSCSSSGGTMNKDSAEEVVGTSAEPQDYGDSKCHGNRVPPTSYEQETAFVPADASAATEEAGRLAVQKLRDRICQGYRCGELQPMIKVWNTERDAMQVCAMAVIKASDVEKFKLAPRKRLANDLSVRAEQLVKNIDTKSDRELRIGIDNIRDSGVDGGPRAEWLIDRMRAALSQKGALIAHIPPDWSGLGLPDGLDAVLRGRITPMHGREAMLEVTWNLDLGRGIKAVDPIAFPELIGPRIDPMTQFPDLAGINPAIALRFDARDGGGLCNGQTTSLRLEASRELHVRVVNLFGEGDKGMVIFASKDAIKAREPLGLGDFQVVKATKVPVERFLVLGAEARSGLGALANVNAPCRLPDDIAKQFSDGRGLPEGTKKYRTSRSYRIMDGPECSSFQPAEMPDDWLASVPTCF